jgi:two-component system, NtrC family, sensor kinase
MPKLIFTLDGSCVEFPLSRASVVLGRDERCDICISRDWISHIHAELKVGETTAEIIDCQSRNGTFVNGVQVKRHRLRDGDRLQFGHISAIYRRDAQPHNARPTLKIGPPLKTLALKVKPVELAYA